MERTIEQKSKMEALSEQELEKVQAGTDDDNEGKGLCVMAHTCYECKHPDIKNGSDPNHYCPFPNN